TATDCHHLPSTLTRSFKADYILFPVRVFHGMLFRMFCEGIREIPWKICYNSRLRRKNSMMMVTKAKKPSSSGGGGNSEDGFGEDEGLARIIDETMQVILEQVEETYIMVKLDVVQHGLVGEIISRFEKKGFKLIGLKLFECPKELAEDVHVVQQSPTLQKSSAASHQLSCLYVLSRR
ncbi:hypothetical protein CMV_025922, partial [Castanea mollissima]